MKLSNKQLFTGKAKGFTLVELLVVIAILATLGALSYGPIVRQMQSAQVLKSTKVCTDLIAAVDSFQLEYQHLPFTGTYPSVDTAYITDEAGFGFIRVLTGDDTTVNTKGISYFDADQADGELDGLVLNTAGDPTKLLDKWGNPYHILLDFNTSGDISLTTLLLPSPTPESGYAAIRRTSTGVALSPGKDAMFDGIDDSTSF